MNRHLVDGDFQSDKYPTTPRGKVPLSTKDKTAQDLLWQYAQRRRAVDADFSDALEAALKGHGYAPPLFEISVLDYRPAAPADRDNERGLSFRLKREDVPLIGAVVTALVVIVLLFFGWVPK